MGLDQAFICGKKGKQPTQLIATFRKHDRLQGYMERLAYQKNIVDPFLMIPGLDYQALEEQIFEEMKALYPGGEMVKNPTPKDMEGKETEEPVHIVYHPSMDIEPYKKGRLHEELVPLIQEDLVLLREKLEVFARALFVEKDVNVQDDLFPPCQGMFFGETQVEDWVKTMVLVDHLLNHFDFKTNDLFYKADW